MKRIVFIAIVLVFICAIAQADNSTRIDELKVQQQVILQEIDRAQKIIQQKQLELVKLQGAIEELVAQDQPVAEMKETKKDKSKK